MARLVKVPVSLELWQEMVTVGYQSRPFKCVEGLPEGAELVSSYYDGKRATTILVFHHESFTDIPTGARIPHALLFYETCETWNNEPEA